MVNVPVVLFKVPMAAVVLLRAPMVAVVLVRVGMVPLLVMVRLACVTLSPVFKLWLNGLRATQLRLPVPSFRMTVEALPWLGGMVTVYAAPPVALLALSVTGSVPLMVTLGVLTLVENVPVVLFSVPIVAAVLVRVGMVPPFVIARLACVTLSVVFKLWLNGLRATQLRLPDPSFCKVVDAPPWLGGIVMVYAAPLVLLEAFRVTGSVPLMVTFGVLTLVENVPVVLLKAGIVPAVVVVKLANVTLSVVFTV